MGNVVAYQIKDGAEIRPLTTEQFKEDYVMFHRLKALYNIPMQEVKAVIAVYPAVFKTLYDVTGQTKLGQIIEKKGVEQLKFFNLDDVVSGFRVAQESKEKISIDLGRYFKAYLQDDDKTKVALMSLIEYFSNFKKEVEEKQKGHDPAYDWLLANYLTIDIFKGEEFVDYKLAIGVLEGILESLNLCTDPSKIITKPFDDYCLRLQTQKKKVVMEGAAKKPAVDSTKQPAVTKKVEPPKLATVHNIRSRLADTPKLTDIESQMGTPGPYTTPIPATVVETPKVAKPAEIKPEPKKVEKYQQENNKEKNL